MRQFIKMQEYQIEVDYGYHVLERLYTRFPDYDVGLFDYTLSSVISDPAVADYLINEVRVGEDVVLIDENSGISFALNIGTDCIYVKTIFNTYEGTLLIAEAEKVLRYAKAKIVSFELFEKRRKNAYA